MAASYEDDERPSRLTHVIHNVTLGHVRVRSEDGPATTVEVPPGEVRFRRVLGAMPPETAIWLDSAEQEYLGRMLEHVLGSMKITDEARAALAAVQSKLAELSPASGGAAESAAAPLNVEPADEPVAEQPPPAPPEPAEPTATAAAVPPDGEEAEAAAEPTPTAPVGRTRAAAQSPALSARRSTAPTPPEPVADSAPAESAIAGAAERRSRTAPRSAARPRADRGGEAAGRLPGADESAAAAAAPAAPTDDHPRGPAVEPATASGPVLPVEHPVPFATVWADLQALGARRPPLHRLTGQTSSEIRDLDDEGVWLYSNSTGRTYQIARSLLEDAWTALVTSGRLVPREVRMSFGAVTLLAHLPTWTTLLTR